MTPPVSDEIRLHYEPVAGALRDIGHALGLLDMVLHELHGRMPEAAEGQMFFLTFAALQAHRKAENHIEPLWLAVGGKSV
jgi:hypothetical protein